MLWIKNQLGWIHLPDQDPDPRIQIGIQDMLIRIRQI